MFVPGKLAKKIFFLSFFFLIKFFVFSQTKIEFKLSDEVSFSMISVSGKNFLMAETEVTQDLYELIMEDNPSFNASGGKFPVECVNWYDAVVFCNLLSSALEKTPVYSVKGSTDVEDWDYSIHSGAGILDEIQINKNADGFRLPTESEWVYAASGGKNYIFSGSNNAEEVAWFMSTSGNFTHEVALKKPNDFGLYDMSGNVWEWCEDKTQGNHFRIRKGGAWSSEKKLCAISFRGSHYPSRYQPCYTYFNMGFRIACNSN